MTPWIEFDSVEFAYGQKEVLSGLSFSISENVSVCAIVGPSGVGKTTLIKLLAGHLAPRRGRIMLCGRQIRGPCVSRPVVFQDHNLFPWMTVLENIAFGPKCAKVSKGKREALSRALLSKMKLHGIDDMLPSSLSGGMKQRVGLARALAVNPSCVLMDEPFSALDPELRESLTCMISELAAEGKCRFVIVTHDVSDALFLADQIIIVHSSGHAEACGFAAPPHPRSVKFRYTEEFLTGMSTVRALLTIGATESS